MKDDLTRRTQELGVEVIRLCEKIGTTSASRIVTNQMIRSATSVGANYRAACRARSRKDFISRLSIVEEEADEVRFWLELLGRLSLVDKESLRRLHDEAGELVAIMVASKKTARLNLAPNQKSQIANVLKVQVQYIGNTSGSEHG